MLARGYLSGVYFPVDSRLLSSEWRPRDFRVGSSTDIVGELTGFTVGENIYNFLLYIFDFDF